MNSAKKFTAGLMALAMAAPQSLMPVLAEETTELEPGVHVNGNEVTFAYKDADEKDAVSVTVSGNMQWLKWEDVGDYYDKGDNTGIKAYDAYSYEEGMFNAGYGLNGDTAVYELEEKNNEYFELTLTLPGTLYYYDYTVTYEDGSTKKMKDPANMPEPNEATGSDAGHSLFYVGSAEDTIKGQEHIYAREDQKGSYEFVPYTAADGTEQYLGVYLPYGYDESKTYKTVYVSHGGGGNENEWMTIGAVPNILDNLIAEGEIEPTIAVTMNHTYFRWNYDQIIENFEKGIFPYMEENYPVSKEAADRALCGLSMGSMTTTTLMQRRPDMFGYFGGFSGANVLDMELDTEELSK